MSRVPDRVPPGPIKLTYEDYVDLPDDGRRYEILDGELEVSPAPAPRHQAVLAQAAGASWQRPGRLSLGRGAHPQLAPSIPPYPHAL